MHSNYINNNKLRQVAFLLILIFLGILLYLQLKVFIPAALGAITLYFMLKEWMKKLVYREKLGKGKAAALLLLSSFLVVLMPIMLFVSMLSGKINYAIAHSNELIATVENFIKNIEKKYHIGIATSENLNKAGTAITNELPNVLSATFDILTTIGIMYFLLYFMLTNTVEMERWLYKHVPLKNTNIARIGKDLKQLVISNAVGIPLIALLQGIIAFVGYWIFGVKDAGFWLVVTSIAAMLPFLGAALVYVPLGILLLSTGPAWKGIALILYGLIVVGTSDNVARFSLQKKIGDIHPLITMFGVIIGLNMFGFIGLIFGPILISMFLLLIKVYIDEFAHEEADVPNTTEPLND